MTTGPADHAGISGHVRPVGGILISNDAAHMVVHWLGSLARYAIDRNGCPPAGLVDTQHAIAEAIIASRPREEPMRCSGPRIPFTPGAGDEDPGAECDVDTAAKALGIRTTTVRWHLTHGRLNGRKFHGRWYITTEELHRFQNERIR